MNSGEESILIELLNTLIKESSIYINTTKDLSDESFVLKIIKSM